jgi:hypothetical protein
MHFVVIGVDHRAQPSNCGLEALLAALLDRTHYEPLTAIAEEWDVAKSESIAQRLARERDLRWDNPDLTKQEKDAAGISDEQTARLKLRGAVRVPSDAVREAAWIKKLRTSESGTTFVLCGYVHFDALVAELRAGGSAVETRVYLEFVPEIRTLTSEELQTELQALER